MPRVVTHIERETFKRCRRAWDFHSESRQGFEPATPLPAEVLEASLRDALAVYYYPGMWTWPRAVVRPMAVAKLRESLTARRAGSAADDEDLELARTILESYFEWAPSVDRGHPVRVDTDFEVHVPDPGGSGDVIRAGDGEPVLYVGRVDAVILEGDGRYWILDHRLALDGFADEDMLVLDDRTGALCWAVERAGRIRVAGVLHNEIGAGACRRTRIAKTPREIATLAAQSAAEIHDLLAADVRVYPAPRPESCARCAYRPPCLALTAGGDATSTVPRGYVKRAETPRGPTRVGERSSW